MRSGGRPGDPASARHRLQRVPGARGRMSQAGPGAEGGASTLNLQPSASPIPPEGGEPGSADGGQAQRELRLEARRREAGRGAPLQGGKMGSRGRLPRRLLPASWAEPGPSEQPATLPAAHGCVGE